MAQRSGQRAHSNLLKFYHKDTSHGSTDDGVGAVRTSTTTLLVDVDIALLFACRAIGFALSTTLADDTYSQILKTSRSIRVHHPSYESLPDAWLSVRGIRAPTSCVPLTSVFVATTGNNW
jgi:hypothetical protein